MLKSNSRAIKKYQERRSSMEPIGTTSWNVLPDHQPTEEESDSIAAPKQNRWIPTRSSEDRTTQVAVVFEEPLPDDKAQAQHAQKMNSPPPENPAREDEILYAPDLRDAPAPRGYCGKPTDRFNFRKQLKQQPQPEEADRTITIHHTSNDDEVSSEEKTLIVTTTILTRTQSNRSLKSMLSHRSYHPKGYSRCKTLCGTICCLFTGIIIGLAGAYFYHTRNKNQ